MKKVKLTVSQQEDNEVQLSLPYIIHIKNLTDEKIYDVKLFDYEFEKQDKIKYSSPISSVDYGQILRTLTGENEPRKVIGTIKAIAFCDYKKFQSKQINCKFSVIYSEINGCVITNPYVFIIDPYQHIDGISQKSGLEINFYNKLQIELAYLMPETEMTIHLYPIK